MNTKYSLPHGSKHVYAKVSNKQQAEPVRRVLRKLKSKTLSPTQISQIPALSVHKTLFILLPPKSTKKSQIILQVLPSRLQRALDTLYSHKHFNNRYPRLSSQRLADAQALSRYLLSALKNTKKFVVHEEQVPSPKRRRLTLERSSNYKISQRGGVSRTKTNPPKSNGNGLSEDTDTIDDDDDYQDEDSNHEISPPSPASIIPKNISPNEKYCKISIIDGTKKNKYGTSYWVQRNVITIHVLASFKFDECRVCCLKENTNDVKLMETLSFKEHFASTFQQLPNGVTVYETQFKKKLPFTSGRPETQKYVWLTADFIANASAIAKCATDKFFVCSRPTSDHGTVSGPQKARTKVLADSMVVQKSKHSSPMAHAAQQAAAHQLHDKANTQQYIMFTGAPQLSTMPGIENMSPSNDSSSTTSTQSSNGENNSPPNLSPTSNGVKNTIPLPPTPSTPHQSIVAPYTGQLDKARLLIQSVTPNTAYLEGFQQVTLHGQFYIPSSERNETLTIYFGLLPSPRIDYVDQTKIVCLTPQRLIVGTVRVTGVLGGKMFENFVLFNYVEKPESQQQQQQQQQQVNMY